MLVLLRQLLNPNLIYQTRFDPRCRRGRVRELFFCDDVTTSSITAVSPEIVPLYIWMMMIRSKNPCVSQTLNACPTALNARSPVAFAQDCSFSLVSPSLEFSSSGIFEVEVEAN